MTPLHIEILMHYYTRGGHPPMLTPTWYEYRDHLERTWGLIEPDTHSDCFHVTEKGSVWINAILSVPFPKQVWVIPTEVECPSKNL